MEKVSIGLIGCGGFALAVHVPNMQKNKKYSIRAVMDVDETKAIFTAKEIGAVYGTSNLDTILQDQSINAVFITTRHDSHAELAIKAANEGKHVFCEKPMGLNASECMAVSEAVRKNNVVYMVGYNRSMAPMIRKACKLLKGDNGKKLVYHRIQAAFPEDHWIHDEITGGGRIVGEGCHIFDLICEIIAQEPVSVYAAGGTFLDSSRVKTPDSGIVTITFKDGSVGTTLIASAGCNDFHKEATEIYCSNKAIYIDDFKKMEFYGFEGQERICMEYSKLDKGQAIEIDSFAEEILNRTIAYNGLAHAARAAIISFYATKSIHSGMPEAISSSHYNF